jgi:cytochrome P450 family 6
MSRFTTDVIASCAFGIDSNSLKNPEADLMRYLRKVYDMSIRKGLAMVTAFFAPSLNKFLRLKYLDDTTSNFFRETVWSTVEYR